MSKKFWLVFKHVYLKNVRSGSWLFMVIFPILLLGISGGVGYIAGSNASDTKLALVADAPLHVDGVHFTKPTTTAKAQIMLEQDKVDGILTVTTKPTIGGQLTIKADATKAGVEAPITQVLSGMKLQATAAALKLPAKDVQALITPAAVTTKSVTVKDGKVTTKDTRGDILNRVFAMTITILIMLITMVYGSLVAQEIATEKGTRIMESLLAAVSATTQFYGKIMAIMALLLTQVALYAVAIAGAWPWLSSLDVVQGFLSGLDLSSLWGAPFAISIAFLLVGTFTYAVLAALAGSLVASIEQVQMAVMPLSMLGMIGYVLSFVAQSGSMMLIKVLAYVPFLNISLMPVELALGHATLTQALISLGIAVVFMVGFTALVARVYRSNVLVYSESGLLKGLRRSLQIMQAEKRRG